MKFVKKKTKNNKMKIQGFKFFTHPDSSNVESSLPTGRQASLREEREKRVSYNLKL